MVVLRPVPLIRTVPFCESLTVTNSALPDSCALITFTVGFTGVGPGILTIGAWVSVGAWVIEPAGLVSTVGGVITSAGVLNSPSA